jgi:hypothetical protein
MPRHVLLGLLMASLLAAPAASAASTTQRLAERGPSTFAVGLAFTLMSPFKLLWGAATGGRVALHACRFGHGVKMLTAGAVLLPAGLVVSPFEAERLPDAWMDGVVDAFQEDYCTRPPSSILP